MILMLLSMFLPLVQKDDITLPHPAYTALIGWKQLSVSATLDIFDMWAEIQSIHCTEDVS